MARLVGVDLPRRKKLFIALTYIFGIGLTSSKKILQATGIDPDKRTEDLTEDDVSRLRDEIEKNYQVEGDLRNKVKMDLKRLQEINCYRGLRHRRQLPCRGQRTKTNSKTRRRMGQGRISPGKKRA